MNAVQGILQSAWQVFVFVWWIWTPIILWPLFKSTWLFWRQSLYKRDLQTKYILLELRIPREIKKNPRAMEQVLIAVHALRNVATDLREIWWDGEVTVWYSLEIVSLGGEIHFYLRTIQKQKDLIQAAFFSYYPDVEVVEVEDYMDRLPANMGEVHKSGYNLWGTELVLAREDAFPIRSYLDFESPDEDKQYDAMSTFLEVLGKVKKEETVGIQILIAPAAPEWGARWKGFVEKLRVREQEKKTAGATHTLGMEFPHILPVFPVKKIGEDDRDVSAPFMKSFMRTPGETDVLKAVEENLSRPGFDTLIRFFYLSPRELFGDTFPRRGVIGAFNQYGSLDLNYFTQNFAVGTRIKFSAETMGNSELFCEEPHRPEAGEDPFTVSHTRGAPRNPYGKSDDHQNFQHPAFPTLHDEYAVACDAFPSADLPRAHGTASPPRGKQEDRSAGRSCDLRRRTGAGKIQIK